MPDRTTYTETRAACVLLGRQIRGIREARDLTDRDLATQTGVMTSTIAAVEAGLDSVPIGTVLRVVTALGCGLTVTPGGATLTPIGDRMAAMEGDAA